MKNKHTTSALLMYAACLITVSGLLMTLCADISVGGVFLASASCMFCSAYFFRMAENKNNIKGDFDDE